ncbi:hypothetical protein [Saccharothrix sp.]|uniref:hypothetical protein n=1 Tax=Saccharothrix sp. TaxID=1873460 RepID=UPI002811EF8D|nr:hypothetical protein [Saccharothrix sp.]
MRTTITRAFQLTACLLAAGVVWFGTATAQPPGQDPPVSGDPRATAYAGNATTCAEGMLPGEIIQVTSNDDGTYLDVTAVPEGYKLTGVVVKGSNAFNTYGDLGPVPWLDLHAPLASSGQPAEISHWFACGIKSVGTTTTTTTTMTYDMTTTTTTTTTTYPTTTTTTSDTTTTTSDTTTTTTTPTTTTTSDTTSTTTTTTTSPATTTTTPVTTTTSPAQTTTTSAPAQTTTTTAPLAVDRQKPLASTGSRTAWMVPIGTLLVLLGGMGVALARRRRFQR